MPNRLAGSTSPYLLQHQNNPVDWYPWGSEAFEKAKAENKLIFLSVGYSSCHWCHVMEHECFEDADVAERLNRDFVCVKVDREERPDVDEAYMTAVQLQAGRGGWPMSVFMTPDRLPFFCGTYFPKHDRGQMPGFISVLTSVTHLWSTRQKDVLEAATELGKQVKEVLSRQPPQTFAQLDNQAIVAAVDALASDFDKEMGGFGPAPKFPPHTAIELLLWLLESPHADTEKRQKAAQMAMLTLEAMALGGLHDHVGGGFHRYSTDAYWVLPHFEKMLYDNALMLGNLVRGARIAKMLDSPVLITFLKAANGIVGWLEREMLTSDGLFCSAIDADSEGEEGKYYVWSVAEIQQVLGDKAAKFIEAYNCLAEGNYRDEATGEQTGKNIPFLATTTEEDFSSELEALFQARSSRVRPGLDDKAIVGWNGLVAVGLIEAGRIDLAERTLQSILNYEATLGELPHQITKGVPTGPAFLDDYACFGYALLRLAIVTQDRGMAEQAKRIAEEMVNRFYDQERGGFYSTGDGHEELFGRTKPVFDQPTPSANATAIRLLLGIGKVEEAMKSLQALFGWMERAPQATEGLYLAAGEFLEAMEAAMMTEAEEEQVTEVAVASQEAKISVDKVRVAVPVRELQAGADGWANGEVHIWIPDGWHINSNDPPMRWLIPTQLNVQPLPFEVQYPASSELGFDGEIVIPFKVRTEGKDREFELTLTYQACTDTECQEPVDVRFDCVIV